MRIFSRSGLFAAIILLLPVFTVQAQTTADNVGPLVIPFEKDGTWEAAHRGGWMLLKNTSAKAAARQYWVDLERVADGERKVSTTIIVRGGGGEAFGGLVLDRSGPNKYLGFTIRQDGAVVLLEKSVAGLHMTVIENASAKMDGSDVLGLIETPKRVALLLNGAEVHAIERAQGFRPGYGIFAMGKGRFGFDGFEIADLPAADDLPPPGGGGADDDPLPPPGGGETAEDDGKSPTPAPEPQAPQLTPEQIYYAQVVLGTTLGVFFHEFGHALIGETGLPATGPEEDVADAFSAFVLSSTVEDGGMSKEEEEFLAGIVKYSALLWYYSGVENARAGRSLPWQDEHAPDLKRFRNAFCILYGSNPARWDQLANAVDLGDRAKVRCQHEHKKRYAAWETILKTVSRDLGPDFPGDHPADTPGGKLILIFQPASTDVGKDVQLMLEGTGTMPGVIARLEKAIVWPRDLMVEFRDCEDVNAWYDPSEAKVTMCYSLVEVFSKIIFDAESGSTPGGGGGGGGGGGTPANEAVAYLTGIWATRIATEMGQIEVNAQFAANGQYLFVTQAGNQSMQVQGNWAAEVAGGNAIRLQLNPTQWSPKQFCDNYGNCEPNIQQPELLTVQYVDQNTLFSDGVNWTRIQ